MTNHERVPRDAVSKYLAGQYRQGMSIRSLATETGRTYGFVRRRLMIEGIQFRPRGGARVRRDRTDD